MIKLCTLNTAKFHFDSIVIIQYFKKKRKKTWFASSKRVVGCSISPEGCYFNDFSLFTSQFTNALPVCNNSLFVLQYSRSRIRLRYFKSPEPTKQSLVPHTFWTPHLLIVSNVLICVPYLIKKILSIKKTLLIGKVGENLQPIIRQVPELKKHTPH